MRKHGKKYVDAAKKAPQGAVSVAEAVAFVKANAFAKFDESVELGMRMGCDPRKSDQMLRGTVSLPHGTGKDVRVVVFAGGAAAEAAKAAGAIEAGTDDLLEKIHVRGIGRRRSRNHLRGFRLHGIRLLVRGLVVLFLGTCRYCEQDQEGKIQFIHGLK